MEQQGEKERQEILLRSIRSSSKAMDSFVHATQFEGSKPGYVFKRGEKGLGYYADRAKATDAPTAGRAPKSPMSHERRKGTSAQKKKRKKSKRKRKSKASALVRSAKGDKKLRSKLQTMEERQQTAAREAERASVLLQEEAGFLEAEDGGRTDRFKQRDIRKAVDVQSAKNVFDLKLDAFGPYRVAYTRNGRHMLLSGEKGHTSLINCQTFRMHSEMHLRETVRDACFLMNETMFAVAQRKYLYIYDQTGMELHCLRGHIKPQRLEYLPYHYVRLSHSYSLRRSSFRRTHQLAHTHSIVSTSQLLCSIGQTGYLKYQDVSTGDLVCELRTKRGCCSVMRHNPQNAVIHCGHHNGVVSLWSPSMSTPLVQMFCHHGPVRALAIDASGKYMASTGSDGQMKIWDLRTYKMMDAYFTTTPGSSLDFSQRGILSVGYGPHVQVWKDVLLHKQKRPYMRHMMPGCTVANLRFRPFEDSLAIGHSGGMSSMVVPGSGEPNYDSYSANPYETKKQRREGEVHKLLEKLSPDMITLGHDETVGDVDRAASDVIARERAIAIEANNAKKPKKKPKKKMRGKNKIGKRVKKHQRNIWDAKRKLSEKQIREEQARRKQERRNKGEDEERSALSRFTRLN